MIGYESLDFHCRKIPQPTNQRSCYKICEKHRHVVSWLVGNWSACTRRDPSDPCQRGVMDGVQVRNVTCQEKKQKEILPEEVCEYFEPKPTAERTCNYKCPRDCIVAAFGDWSPCARCDWLNSTRRRDVIAPPKNGGADCPPLSEQRPCPHSVNCKIKQLEFFYKVDAWGACRVSKGKRHKPGFQPLGYERRKVECVSSNGTLVDER